MTRLVAKILLFFVCFPVHAKDEVSCTDFQTRSGTELIFKTEELYKKYGFQSFREAPSGHKSMPYESLAGRKGKVVGGQSGPHGIAHYHEVLLDDCRTVYWYDTNDQLNPEMLYLLASLSLIYRRRIGSYEKAQIA